MEREGSIFLLLINVFACSINTAILMDYIKSYPKDIAAVLLFIGMIGVITQLFRFRSK